MKRRGFLLGLGAAFAAPAIVRAELLMPVRSLIVPKPVLITPYIHGIFQFSVDNGATWELIQPLLGPGESIKFRFSQFNPGRGEWSEGDYEQQASRMHRSPVALAV